MLEGSCTMKIGIVGKGWVGKTTTSSLIARSV
jgi:CO dehydrogenase nickel-insertion accessory protein CooC1